MDDLHSFTAWVRSDGRLYKFTDKIECGKFSAELVISDERIKLMIDPKQEQIFDELSVTAFFHADNEDKIFLNGYQSRTDSREFSPDEKMRGLHGIPASAVRKYCLDKYGDQNFTAYPNKAGFLHGWSYAYVRNGSEFLLMGSMDERNGFTRIDLICPKNRVRFSRDCEGAVYSERFAAIDMAVIKGGENDVFDRWFGMLDVNKPAARPLTGFTSWYKHYRDISQEKLLRDLDDTETNGTNNSVFRIDDGYQTAVGDWLSIDRTKFPYGIACISDKAHEKGMLSGLWIAPFICESDSELFRTKRSWLLKDKSGEPVPAGYARNTVYALDIFNDEVRNYIRNVLDTVLNKWGFDFVELDHLYAVCMIPHYGRPRGEIMCEAMDFLRECVGEKLMEAAGVPLMPAFGKADYCRIGCDVGLDHDGSFLMQMTHRERTSTKNSMLNTIFRRQLDGRAFLNDPDVYLLRDEDISLYNCQKRSLAMINNLFGTIYFTSDNAGTYTEYQKKVLNTAEKLRGAEVVSAESCGDTVKITIRLAEKTKTFYLLPDGRLSDMEV